MCLERVVVVYVNRRSLHLGRHEAGDDRAQLMEGFGAVQERFCEQGQWMYWMILVEIM